MEPVQLKKPSIFHPRMLVLLGLIALCFWGLYLNTEITLFQQDTFTTVNTGWVQVLDGVEYPLDTAQDAIVPFDGGAIVLQRTIATTPTRSLLFFASHQEVSIYIDDLLVYDATCPEILSDFASPGRHWVELPIQSDMIGKTMRLEISSPFPQYQRVPSVFYYILNNEIQSVQTAYMWIRNIATLCILALAIISYINASLWKRPKLRRYIFSLADLYLFTGLWLCGEINILSLLFGNASLSSLFAMLFLRLIPVVFCQLVGASMMDNPLWLRLMKVVAWSNLIVSVFLQLFCGVSLVTSLSATILTFAFSCTIYIIAIIRQCWGKRYPLSHQRTLYAAILFPAASLVEIYVYMTHVLGEVTGMFVAIACILYATIAHVVLVKYEAYTAEEKLRLEQYQNTLEKKPLYQQINAHFLFNTLNTISAYCKEDPAKADKAVGLLAQYMRRYTYLVDANDYVPFEEESTLIHIYMDILNLRYGDEIQLSFDIPFDDFSLPPLSLQPLVENAVQHGLHHYVSDAVIHIATKRQGQFIEVTVSDNGHGFTDQDAEDSTGVGLKNLKRRLRAMGGELNIKSQLDKGTTVTLKVPLLPPPLVNTGKATE